jgi:hypothetical protein
MARLKPLPGHCLTFTGAPPQAGTKEVAMVKGGVGYSFFKAMIMALSMSLAVMVLARVVKWT